MSLKKYQIFISSTYTDLIEAREKIIKTILKMYHFPIGMEMFSASDDEQWEIIKDTIIQSDYYLLIIGHRYGTISSEGISYTEKEYDFAKSIGVPVMSFIRDRNIPTIPGERDNDIDSIHKLEKFIKKTKESKMCDVWTTSDDLAHKVSIALSKAFINHKRTGWIRDSEKTSLDLHSCLHSFLIEKERLGLKQVTIKTYRDHLKVLCDFFEEIKVDVITVDHIKKFFYYRETNFNIRSKNSLETIRGTVKVFFDWLVDEKLIDNNPVLKIKPYVVTDAEIEPLNKEEIKILRQMCKTIRQRAIIEFLLSTGCKLDELRQVKLNNFDWNKNTVKIPGTRKRNRVVPLTKQAVIHLTSYLKTRDDSLNHLFITERKPYRCLSNRGIQRDIRILVRHSKLNKNISTKTFRHTFAKEMLKKKIPINIVQSLLGYSDHTSATETYSKITNDNIHQLLQK